MSDFFDLHRPTLESAVSALACREYWTPYPEVPSGKIYGETAKADGEAAFTAQIELLPASLSLGSSGKTTAPEEDTSRFRLSITASTGAFSGSFVVTDTVAAPTSANPDRVRQVTRKIPFTVQAAGRETSTNADAIYIAQEGVATALVSIPNRYMHSPNEMVSLVDVDHTAELIAEVCRMVDRQTDFTAR